MLFQELIQQYRYFVNGGLAGLTVLIEIPARRLELALYCLPRAIESFWRCGVKWGRWKYLPYVFVVF